MDASRRPSYPNTTTSTAAGPPPPAHAQQQHQHQYHGHYPPPAHPSSAYAHHAHTPIDTSRSHPPPPPPPPPPFAHPSSNGPPPPPGASYPGQSASGPPGPSLPPLQQSHGPSTTLAEAQSLPPFRRPAHPHAHEHPPPPPREAQDFNQYHSHDRSGHATPAPVSRSYSHDSMQRTPTTPIVPAPNGTAYPHPPPHSMEHVQYHGYPPTNGVHQGGHHHPPPPPPPLDTSPHYPPPMMENHYATPTSQSMYQPPPPHYGGPATYITPSIQGKRKQMRATQACEQCRQRKQKCDEGNPCSFCKENQLPCNYRDTPPAKVDKNMEKLLQFMESHSAAIQSLSSRFDSFDRRLGNVEHTGLGSVRSHDVKTENHASFSVTTPRGDDMHHSDLPHEDTSPDGHAAMVEKPGSRKHELEDHRTAPQKLLLLWPSVARLFKHAKVEINDTYVAIAEDRPILRLYTKGEGIDEHDGTQIGGPASPARSDRSGENGASPQEGIWGHGLPQTPNSDARRSDPHSLGGVKPDGTPDLDVGTINMLYDSYLKHIHIMHPFLDKGRLRKLIDHFIKRYATGHPHLRHKFAVGETPDEERPLKRQRSSGKAGIATYENVHHRNEYVTERSPSNAVVWLVLALGKICLHKESLPDVTSRSKPANIPDRNTSSMLANSPVPPVKASPISPVAMSMGHSIAPSLDGHNRSRRSSTDGTSSHGTRNVDVIPGLAYYAKAVEVLGDQGDGNDLIHAQMFLLAGLYKGQLARVKESMSWITMASRACMNLLDRYKLYNDHYWSTYGDVKQSHLQGQARIKDKRHSLIVLASWTALQLESDILAELRLPSSGIQTIENMLLMPHAMSENEKDSYEFLTEGNTVGPDKGHRESYDGILIYYTAQLFLRRKLNQMHREMYGSYTENQTLSQVRGMIVGHDEILNLWRIGLPDALQWDDDEPPPSDILPARLRAKYWGARYVSNRPFLDYCLHIMPYLKEGLSIQQAAVDVNGAPRPNGDIKIFEAIHLMSEDDIWNAARRCINAAMKSTVAFDGIEGRLWVTNIHGTAHSQFGNMLVLSTCYHNSFMRGAIDETRFAALLHRTIAFLNQYAAISRTCQSDATILQRIENRLFPGASEASSTSTSFTRIN